MEIASVIVDVPTKQTDRAFDYLIPEQWRGTIQPGMRVIVPFGPRQIQGFVVGLKTESDVNKVREIIEPMDLKPVLNQELLELGSWLTENTLCFKIFAFQVMLPAALKARYEKKVKLAVGVEVTELAEPLRGLFNDHPTVNWEDALKKGLVPLLQKEAVTGKLEVVYVVKEKVKKKLMKFVRPLVSHAELKAEAERFPTKAEKQKQVLSYFAEHFEPIELRQLV